MEIYMWHDKWLHFSDRDLETSENHELDYVGIYVIKRKSDFLLKWPKFHTLPPLKRNLRIGHGGDLIESLRISTITCRGEIIKMWVVDL